MADNPLMPSPIRPSLGAPQKTASTSQPATVPAAEGAVPAAPARVDGWGDATARQANEVAAGAGLAAPIERIEASVDVPASEPLEAPPRHSSGTLSHS